MADKTIGELPAISTLSDTAMIPAEQSGAAGRISGLQFKRFAIDSVSEYVATATEAAETASGAAETASGAAGSASDDATAAALSATAASNAKDAILNMGVAATTLPPEDDATVTKQESGGVVTLIFGLPKGQNGSQGIQGPAGPQGVQGPRGDTGTAVAVETTGMYYFSVDNDSESPTFGHLFLTYTGSTAPDFSIDENGHLIWTTD